MKFLYSVQLFLLIILISSCAQVTNHTEQKNTTNNIAGTWKLVEFIDIDSTGKSTDAYGKNPVGYFIYGDNNVLSINISSGEPMHITEDSAKKMNVNLQHFVNNYAFGYFGTYSIDTARSIVIHHVEGGSMPWYNNTDQPRPFKLKGDTLIIGDNITYRVTLVKVR